MIVPHFFQSSEQTCGAACLRMLGAALGVAQDEATIAQYYGITELGCTVQDLVIGAHAMGLQAEMLPVFSWPAAIETLVMIRPTGLTVVCHATIFSPRGRLPDIEESVYGSRSTCTRVSTG